MKQARSLGAFFSLSFFLVCGSIGCGRGSDGASFDGLDSLALEAWQHVQELSSTFPAALAQRYDQKRGVSSFLQVFGGYEGEAVQGFIQDRIHFLYSEHSEKHLYFEPSFYRHRLYWNSYEQSGVERLGENVGASFFLLSRLNAVPVHLIYRKNAIEIHSTRVGIVKLGSFYFKQPRELQWVTLVHEARHSDCSVPLYEEDLKPLRELKKGQKWDSVLQKKECGHLHVRCIGRKGLENSYACDGHVWGAYAVGALLLLGISPENTDASNAALGLQRAAVIDMLSRVLVLPDVNLARSQPLFSQRFIGHAFD